MKNAVIALCVALALSLILNAKLAKHYLEKRDEAVQLDEKRKKAVGDAESCTKGVEELATAAARKAQDASADIRRAQVAASAAQGRAEAERRRKPAVVGDACASAQVETRQWLENRRVQK